MPASRARWPRGSTLAASQRRYLDDHWAVADIEVEGDPELQQALRFALLHVLQASARAETRAIPAKGLTGPGYDGHAFWDTETYVLPVLTYTAPALARDALSWRHEILDHARARRNWTCAELRSPGGRFAARNAPATGRLGPLPST